MPISFVILYNRKRSVILGRKHISLLYFSINMKQFTKRSFLFLLQFTLVSLLIAQNAALPTFQDGRMWLKVKADLHLSLPTMQHADEIRNLATYPELMALMQKHEGTLLKKAFKLPEMRDFYEINYNAHHQADAFVRDLQKLSFIDFAEKMPMNYPTIIPNDYNAIQQWHLNKIEAPLAWDVSTGSAKIKIAIVDDAVKRDHEDLATQIWANPGEVAGDGLDNDGNGYIDDKYGYDPADSDGETTPPASIVDCQSATGGFCHGTGVASCAASATNNSKGVAGIAYNCKIIPVKCRSDLNSVGGITHGYEGIEYACIAGAQVINCSWGGTGSSNTAQALVTAIRNRGCLIVAGAGNNGDGIPFYPADYASVISVAASNANDNKSGFSCYHDSVDVTAPGSNIRMAVATTTTSYANQDGTSFSSPITAGLCGLMLSANPCLTVNEIEYHLKASCDFFNDMNNPTYQGKLGAGRINAKKALQAVAPTAAPTAAFAYNVTSCGGTVDYSYNSTTTMACPTSFKWFLTGASTTFSTDKNVSVSYPASGTYSVKIIVSNSFGSDTLEQMVNVTVNPLPNLTFATDTITGCYGDSLQLNAICNTGVSYLWSPAVGLNATNVLSPKVKCTAPRTYYLTAIDANGCEDTDTLRVDVKPKPANVTANDVTGAANTDIQLTATCSTAGITYLWEPNISLSNNTIANPICNTPNSRLYMVTVANQFNCTKTDYALVDVGVTGIDFPNGNIAAIEAVYPNPAKENVTLKAQFLQSSAVAIRLFDINGKFIRSVFEGKVNEGTFQYNVERGGISAGVYTIAWEVDGKLMTQKLTFE